MGSNTANNNIAPAMLVLRILSLLLLVSSVVVFVTNSFTLSDGEKVSFKDVFAYRYVIAVEAIGAAYLTLQLPLAGYHAATGKRLIVGKLLLGFDFYADKLISLLLASGVGSGFAISFELKKTLADAYDTLIDVAETSSEASVSSLVPLLQEIRAKTQDVLVRGYIASGILLGACVFMIIVSVLSSINRTK